MTEREERPFDKVRRKMVAARIEFMSQLAKFSNDELTRSPAEGEWSALQIAHHLYITDGLALEQMRTIQTEDNPTLANLGEEAPRHTRASESPVSLDAVLAGMAARREEIFQFLSDLPDEAWERPYVHPIRGQLTFYQRVETLPMHDQAHAQQLAALKSS